jgi:hypothetical protein
MPAALRSFAKSHSAFARGRQPGGLNVVRGPLHDARFVIKLGSHALPFVQEPMVVLLCRLPSRLGCNPLSKFRGIRGPAVRNAALLDLAFL